jgi:hypothetical protein
LKNDRVETVVGLVVECEFSVANVIEEMVTKRITKVHSIRAASRCVWWRGEEGGAQFVS